VSGAYFLPTRVESSKNIKVLKNHATGATTAWLLHFADKPPSPRFFAQPMTAEEALDLNPQALAAEPYQEPVSIPDLALSPDEASLLLRWLHAIEETELVGFVFEQCRTNFIQRQGWLLLANKHFESKEKQ